MKATHRWALESQLERNGGKSVNGSTANVQRWERPDRPRKVWRPTTEEGVHPWRRHWDVREVV